MSIGNQLYELINFDLVELSKAGEFKLFKIILDFR
jgi:hypothetical protein